MAGETSIPPFRYNERLTGLAVVRCALREELRRKSNPNIEVIADSMLFTSLDVLGRDFEIARGQLNHIVATVLCQHQPASAGGTKESRGHENKKDLITTRIFQGLVTEYGISKDEIAVLEHKLTQLREKYTFPDDDLAHRAKWKDGPTLKAKEIPGAKSIKVEREKGPRAVDKERAREQNAFLDKHVREKVYRVYRILITAVGNSDNKMNIIKIVRNRVNDPSTPEVFIYADRQFRKADFFAGEDVNLLVTGASAEKFAAVFGISLQGVDTVAQEEEKRVRRAKERKPGSNRLKGGPAVKCSAPESSVSIRGPNTNLRDFCRQHRDAAPLRGMGLPASDIKEFMDLVQTAPKEQPILFKDRVFPRQDICSLDDTCFLAGEARAQMQAYSDSINPTRYRTRAMGANAGHGGVGRG